VTDRIVELTGLTKVYRGMDRPALDDLSLAIEPGRFFGLLGPNGAGKSTMLSILCGLRRPTRGQVRILGQDVGAAPQAVKAVLGLVPQDLALYPTLTARENLEFFGRMQGLAGSRLVERVAACLRMAGLEHSANRRAETYSGGLKRRLNLVIGLIHEPKLLILDEPTVGIDPQSRHFIHESLRQLHRDGMSIIYSTHYMEEAEQLCDDIAIIDRGRILARGSVHDLLRKHREGGLEIHVENDLTDKVVESIRALPGVRSLRANVRSFHLTSDHPEQLIAGITDILSREKLAVTSLSLGANSLEQVFLELTGTRLRD